jgi:hypothetical protein
LVVGVVESDDSPKRAALLAPPLPDIHDLIDRLRMAIGDVTDPPIAGLEIASVLSAAEAEAGYVVITIPRSLGAPHGIGRPPQTYVRRDDRSEPATMRDIQNTFWEMRARRERIDREFDARSFSLRQYRGTPKAIYFQFTVISEAALSIANLPRDSRAGRLFAHASHHLVYEPMGAAEFPANFQRWAPTSRGIEYIVPDTGYRHGEATWTIDETGVISVTSPSYSSGGGFASLQGLGRTGLLRAFHPC